MQKNLLHFLGKNIGLGLKLLPNKVFVNMNKRYCFRENDWKWAIPLEELTDHYDF